MAIPSVAHAINGSFSENPLHAPIIGFEDVRDVLDCGQISVAVRLAKADFLKSVSDLAFGKLAGLRKLHSKAFCAVTLAATFSDDGTAVVEDQVTLVMDVR